MLSEEKGINNLIDAWKKANIDGLKLKIAGTVDSSIINEENFSNPNIEFLGYVPHKKLMRIMQNSRAVITVTKLLEGQPRLLCEASSLGVPSIYPSFGGMNEYFPNKYPFAFVQYNYIDLIEKLKKLIDEDLLNIKSKEVHSHVAEKLNHECLLKTFENNIKGLEVKNL
jgi:glycosyltransferase involved in cell wall biosynthesis